jgi:hypothetical protein
VAVVNVEAERDGRQDDDCRQQAESGAPQQPEQQGIKEVKLLFNRQRPQMQQRLQIRSGIKIADFLPENEILNEPRASGDVFAQLRVFVRQEQEPASGKTGKEHQNQRRKNPADTVGVELGEAEVAVLQALKQDRRNQIAGNDEENIDADKAAGQASGECMKDDNRENGNGAESVDVRTVVNTRGIAGG